MIVINNHQGGHPMTKRDLQHSNDVITNKYKRERWKGTEETPHAKREKLHKADELD